MTFIFILCFYIVSVSAYSNHSKVFRKCCPKNKSLMKVSTFDMINADIYKCLDSDSFINEDLFVRSNILVDPRVNIDHGLPDDCELQEILVSEKDLKLMANRNVCYDKLITEINNYTANTYIPNTVALKCNGTDLMPETKSEISDIVKCCSNGQVYDTEFHLCRDDNISNNEDWIQSQLKVVRANISALKSELCLPEEYAVELKEGSFKFALNGSALKIRNVIGGSDTVIPKEYWCIDQEYNTRMLVARVCTLNCSTFGAFCMRKCCNEGEYFWRCGSATSYCRSNSSVLFNITSYLEPLRREYDIGDVIGVRTGFEIECPNGSMKYILQSSLESDWHALSKDGWLNFDSHSTNDYCVESFDTCDKKIHVTAMVCRAKTNKNYSVSFVLLSISAACLALTLGVYCLIPKKRNLHGLTLICHVGTMLLAYSCLARVQFGPVNSINVCTALGYGIYFGFVAAFFWLNVMCVDIWWTMSHIRTVERHQKRSATRKKFLRYSSYAWGFSLTFTLVTFLLDKYPITPFLDANIGNGYCWFGSATNSVNDWPHYILFVIPLGLLSIVNCVLWVLTVLHCARVKSAVQRMQTSTERDGAKRRFNINKDSLMLTGKLGVVMGVTWIMELISTLLTNPDGTVPWTMYIMDRINELQGFWILAILVFKPKKLYNFLNNKLGLQTLFKSQSGPKTQSTPDTSLTSIPSATKEE